MQTMRLLLCAVCVSGMGWGAEAHGGWRGSGRDVAINSGAIYQETSGVRAPCHLHQDCYNYREPIDWCQPTNYQQWTNKGCHCNQFVGSCVIERFDSNIRKWTFCSPVSGWYCPNPRYNSYPYFYRQPLANPQQYEYLSRLPITNPQYNSYAYRFRRPLANRYPQPRITYRNQQYPGILFKKK